MEYKEYQHIVKLDDPEVEGLTVGKCHIFPKLDGTNASIWLSEEKRVSTGSRRRDLSEPDAGDNAGFRGFISSCVDYDHLFADNPELRLYGEWLVWFERVENLYKNGTNTNSIMIVGVVGKANVGKGGKALYWI